MLWLAFLSSQLLLCQAKACPFLWPVVYSKSSKQPHRSVRRTPAEGPSLLLVHKNILHRIVSSGDLATEFRKCLAHVSRQLVKEITYLVAVLLIDLVGPGRVVYGLGDELAIFDPFLDALVLCCV